MPLLFQHTRPRLGVWKVTESVDELLSMTDRSVLTAEFFEMKSETRRRERLATLLLLKAMLGHDVLLSHRPSGAPLLVNEPFAVSITHTRGYVALLLAPLYEATGVDIEYTSDRVCHIRERFLSEEELRAVDPGRETAWLLVAWCAKETLYKMIDLPDVDFIRHLHLLPFTWQEEGEVELYETRTDKQRHYRLHYQVTPDYTLVCSAPISESGR